MSLEKPPEKPMRLPEKEEIRNPEIKKLREPIRFIIFRMGEKLERGEYPLIISDEVSGRFPSLIFREFLRRIYERRGYKTPGLMFIAGGQSEQAALRQKKVDEIGNKVLEFRKKKKIQGYPKRILIVTETIETGRSLRPIIEALRKIGQEFDIATVGCGDKEKIHKFSQTLFNTEVFWGLSGTPSIYHDKILGGVEKSRAETFPRKLPDEQRAQIKINSANKDAKIIGEELAEWFEDWIKERRRRKSKELS
jgi:hypothetical protein